MQITTPTPHFFSFLSIASYVGLPWKEEPIPTGTCSQVSLPASSLIHHRIKLSPLTPVLGCQLYVISMGPGQTGKGRAKEQKRDSGNRGGGDLIKAKASRKLPRRRLNHSQQTVSEVELLELSAMSHVTENDGLSRYWRCNWAPNMPGVCYPEPSFWLFPELGYAFLA